MDMSLSKLQELVMDGGVPGVGKSRTPLSYWTELSPFNAPVADVAPLLTFFCALERSQWKNILYQKQKS